MIRFLPGSGSTESSTIDTPDRHEQPHVAFRESKEFTSISCSIAVKNSHQPDPRHLAVEPHPRAQAFFGWRAYEAATGFNPFEFSGSIWVVIIG